MFNGGQPEGGISRGDLLGSNIILEIALLRSQ